MLRRLTTIFFVITVLVAAPATGAADTVEQFAGTYDWSDGGSDELTSEFKPTGDDSWKVKFRFRFSGKRNTWKGTAKGSLAEGGTISGTAGWKGRTWEFEATVESGVLRGSHTEILKGGKRYDTGSFEMKRSSSGAR